jgi:hypothetical protein
MKNDDEIIAEIMKEGVSEYIADDGFTAGVVKSLPKRWMSPSARRMTLVISSATVGCVLAGGLAWPTIAGLAARLGNARIRFDTPTALVVSLALAAALGLGAYYFAREESAN